MIMQKNTNNIIVATTAAWYIPMAHRLADSTGFSVTVLQDRTELTIDRIKALAPRYIFFPHWSHIIPENIYLNFDCVIFHMTDLPFGRGGSPLQNLISRGMYETKISAIVCSKEIDAGAIYLKVPFSLKKGSAQEIFERAVPVIEMMIERILSENIVPQPQQGDVVTFKRRTPEQSNFEGIAGIEKIYDHIRMLDCPGYPPAFLNLPGLKIEFRNAKLDGGELNATVRIIERSKNDE
jgi:methionyl-tRNA formyltransferase